MLESSLELRHLAHLRLHPAGDARGLNVTIAAKTGAVPYSGMPDLILHADVVLHRNRVQLGQ
jgi:hypothetical protein